jgi:transcriptional accessory protein Tex/SPT6
MRLVSLSSRCVEPLDSTGIHARAYHVLGLICHLCSRSGPPKTLDSIFVALKTMTRVATKHAGRRDTVGQAVSS